MPAAFSRRQAATNANCAAQWNGSDWAPLGSGVGGGPVTRVYALAVSGTNLYAGSHSPNGRRHKRKQSHRAMERGQLVDR